MKKLKILALFLSFFLIGSNSIASESTYKESSNYNKLPPDSVIDNWITPKSRFMKKANLSCGIPPIPPIGCTVGACICDQYGRNCRWTFVCN